MKWFFTVFACVALVCGESPAKAEGQGDVTKAVRVPAGDLGDAVEALAKQAEVNVIYAGDLLDGHTTAGVAGTLSPKAAFARLLQDTSLSATEERGALLIAKAAASAPAAIASEPLVTQAMAAGTSAIWVRRELLIYCVDCDYQLEMKRILERLGATEITANFQSASFLSLAPAGDSARTETSKSATATHWETMVFFNEREGRWKRENSLAAWPALRVGPQLYDSLRTSILPRFTTRHISETKGLIAVDVLVSGAAPPASECHRVIQGNRAQRYCGSRDQWLGLQVRVGFRCRNEGRRNELCAPAREWKRIDLAQSTQIEIQKNYFYSDEARQSVMQNHPTNTVVPAVSAPVSTPAPAPAPVK